ncbi:MAG: hypothetical protein P4M09_20485 [Devosia sp.]|nr:hypothetical protein [Devosia sp.]
MITIFKHLGPRYEENGGHVHFHGNSLPTWPPPQSSTVAAEEMMDDLVSRQPDGADDSADNSKDAPCGAAPAQQPLRGTARRMRHGSERVFVDDLSYEPMGCIDTLLVTFAD